MIERKRSIEKLATIFEKTADKWEERMGELRNNIIEFGLKHNEERVPLSELKDVIEWTGYGEDDPADYFVEFNMKGNDLEMYVLGPDPGNPGTGISCHDLRHDRQPLDADRARGAPA